MNRIALALVLLAGCADRTSTTSEPVLTGDVCATYATATACGSDATCMWFGTGCACPVDDPTCTCSPGVCGPIDGGSGSGSGSGSASAACACPGDEVCYEQIGGPAQPAGTTPTIACIAVTAGSGDPCARIAGEGTCTDDATITGLCRCDNGIR